MDEARHVEAYSRLLHEKFELAYPITHGSRSLLEQRLSDSRWDMTYLTMQILIEGWRWPRFSASATSRRTRSPPRSTPTSCRTRRGTSPSAGSRCATTTRSSATPSATSARSSSSTRRWHMRDRFNQLEVWQRLGLADRGVPARSSISPEAMKLFRSRIFSRIVPTVRDIGLWGPRCRRLSRRWARSSSPSVDAAALLDNDARVADEFDARLRLRDATQPA